MSTPAREVERPRIRPVRLLVAWVLSAAALLFAAWVMPGVNVNGFGGALVAAALVAILNALLPPLLAALRLPFMLVLGLPARPLRRRGDVLFASEVVTDGSTSTLRWAALGAAFVASRGRGPRRLRADDDDTYTLRVTQRIAQRSGERVDGSAGDRVPRDRRPRAARPPTCDARRQRSGHGALAPDGRPRARRVGDRPLLADGSEPGRDPARLERGHPGLPLGGEGDADAMTCSAPADCAEIERRRLTGAGLLANGGASRGNLLSGEADHVILTVSRMEAEKSANPGYRAFFANGFNVTRTLVLFTWEVVLEVRASASARRNVRPRGHRGGAYPLMRAALCVVVRDLIVYGVLSDMMRAAQRSTRRSRATTRSLTTRDWSAPTHSRPCGSSTSSSAASNGPAVRAKAVRDRRPLGPRPDAGGNLQAAKRLRPRRARRSVARERRRRPRAEGRRAATRMVGHAIDEATRPSGKKKKPKNDVSDRDVIVLGSGNLGLVYLMEERRRLTLRGDRRAPPELLPALRSHPHIGWVLVRSKRHGPVALGAAEPAYLERGASRARTLSRVPADAAQHLLRTDGFPHVADIMVGSFYDPTLEEGCAFEELISFHGGLGGPQTRPFLLYPAARRPGRADRRRGSGPRAALGLAGDAPGRAFTRDEPAVADVT